MRDTATNVEQIADTFFACEAAELGLCFGGLDIRGGRNMVDHQRDAIRVPHALGVQLFAQHLDDARRDAVMCHHQVDRAGDHVTCLDRMPGGVRKDLFGKCLSHDNLT